MEATLGNFGFRVWAFALTGWWYWQDTPTNSPYGKKRLRLLGCALESGHAARIAKSGPRRNFAAARLALEARAVNDLHEGRIPTLGGEHRSSASVWLAARPSRLVFCAQPGLFHLESPINSLEQ